jgi:hypothetical protein
MEIKKRGVAELTQDPRNARSHDGKNIEAIKRSLQEFGQQKPIVVNTTGKVVAGNGTLAAALDLGWDKIAVVETDLVGSSAAAYAIADNRTAELAAWDDDALAETLASLQNDESIDELITGFSEKEIEEIIGNASGDIEEDEVPENYMNEAWKRWSGEVKEQCETLMKTGSVFSGITKGYATIHFLKAKYQNAEYPRHCSIAFHPHQVTTTGSGRSLICGLERVSSGEAKPEGLRFACHENPRTNDLMASMPFSGAKIPLDFPASLAKQLIVEFSNDGNVLDPCHGWGGRLVGFFLSNAKSYCGVDVSPLQSNGVKDILDTFKQYAEQKKEVELICDEYENAKIEQNKYDMALTSPPYFDVEKYDDGKQCYEGVNYEEWKESFYAPLILKTYESLKPDGVFVLQIGSQKYPLLKDGKKIAEAFGFVVEETRKAPMRNGFKTTADEESEVLLILRKGGA